MTRTYLSPPHMCGRERELVGEAFDTNWIAPLGPHVDGFEQEICERVDVGHAAALSSGTAALHLGLMLLGVQAGDEVLCSSFTFAASANAITYVGATPVFIDSTADTWCMDPDLLAAELAACNARKALPAAVVSVDLYGQCPDYAVIEGLCAEYGVPLIEDAAESLGATCNGRPAGSFGDAAILSFNGNKIITSGGGGMLLSDRRELVERARFLATQARDPAPHYQHTTVGYNYRLSNVLAAIGRGQLSVLDERVNVRREINRIYREELADIDGLEFMPEAAHGRSSCWLTCLTLDPTRVAMDREQVRQHLETLDIESRPTWKPMHMQPVFAHCRARGGDVSARLFEHGLCLPSGTALSPDDVRRIAGEVRRCVAT